MARNIKKTIDRFPGLIQTAYDRISSEITETRLYFCEEWSEKLDISVHLKLECEQRSGSFKIRGVLNKLMSYPDFRHRSYVAASTGNHGAAFATCAALFNLEHTLFLPENVSPSKLNYIENLGTNVILYGKHCLDTELRAIQYAEDENQTLVHPYDDLDIISGQGTVGLEIEKQMPDVDAIIVPVGGGGLISGIAGWWKNVNPDVRIIGCQPENSPEMAKSLLAGEIVEMPPKDTLSDATAGGMVPDSVTFPICQHLIDEMVLLSEQEIGSAILSHIKHHQLYTEGSAALSLAALWKKRKELIGKKVVLLVTGKRLALPKLRTVIEKYIPFI